jgi:outer membrane lipoprotein
MRYHLAKSRCAVMLLALLLSACASQVPLNIRKAPADNPALEQVRENTTGYLGRQVRWGGTIIATSNREASTVLTMLGRPLYRGGEPKFTDDSTGRFIAIVPEFLDPQVYAPDRQVTVSGTLLHTEDGKVGEHPYNYPVVQADAWYLWPEITYGPYGYPSPLWQDPWYYDPWYPYVYPYRYRYWR